MTRLGLPLEKIDGMIDLLKTAADIPFIGGKIKALLGGPIPQNMTVNPHRFVAGMTEEQIKDFAQNVVNRMWWVIHGHAETTIAGETAASSGNSGAGSADATSAAAETTDTATGNSGQ